MPSSRVAGLKEFRAALKLADAEAPRALRDVHKELADKAAMWAQSAAHGGTKLQQAAASVIKGSGTQAQASIAVSNSKVPFANIAFWGARRRFGWYGDTRYAQSTRQFPEWVGNNWDTGVRGEGPYVINAALADHMDELLDEYGNLVDDIAREAFPTKGL